MRLLFLSLLASILLSLPAVGQSQLTMNYLMATPIKVRGADCALFPAAASMHPYDRIILAKDRFTPTRQQVATAERLLPTLAARYLPHTANKSYSNINYVQAHLSKYKRQYFGFYNAQHQPCLFINFLESSTSNWLSNISYVDDGGNDFWRVRCNLTSQQFWDFSQNTW